MKISIVTPTYNSAKTIARTIDSVIAQTYPDLEYIIIDGASSDNTKDIVSSYQDKINIKFVSEKDKGIYDAMNKGIKLATASTMSSTEISRGSFARAYPPRAPRPARSSPRCRSGITICPRNFSEMCSVRAISRNNT